MKQLTPLCRTYARTAAMTVSSMPIWALQQAAKPSVTVDVSAHAVVGGIICGMETRCTISHPSQLSLAGLFNSPDVDASQENQVFPLVLLLHGFTGWKEELHLSSLAKGLSAQGIATLRFDAVGSGESA